MRLHWFLPPRRSKAKRRAGPIRRALKRIAPSWLASPVRRVIQTACFLGFFWLFLYVCWPYTARPARVWRDWKPSGVELNSGKLTLTTERPTDEPPAADTVLYVVDESVEPHSQVGQYRIRAASRTRLQLEPVGTSHRAWLSEMQRQLQPELPSDTIPQQPRVWADWLPEDVDAESGQAVISGQQPPDRPIVKDTLLRVVDAATPDGDPLGLFQVAEVLPDRLTLVPTSPPAPDQLDRLLASFGPWSLHEVLADTAASDAPTGAVPLCSLREAKPGSWPAHYADELMAKEVLPADSLLALDPLVSISTALAAKSWVWSLSCAGVILLVCLLIPRGFCGYVCPLGTLIDLFDWALGRRIAKNEPIARGWWVRLKYYVLAATLIMAFFGVLISGFVAAIPVITRAMAFLLTPLQMGVTRDWHQIPALGIGHFVSIAMFLAVLGLGLLRPRFWCKYVCPSGALFSAANLLRLTERRVESNCIACGKCVDACPFDAIRPDFATRTDDCTFCQTCGGVCPVGAIEFVARWQRRPMSAPLDQPVEEPIARRRGFLAAGITAMAGCLGGGAMSALLKATGARPSDSTAFLPVRPPGSVPELEFLQLCIRCGECFQACPNGVLQPVAFEQGIEGLWTPQVVADHSGCEPSCSNCGQVCPTGAIRALPLREKRVARIGLAVVDKKTCLPYATGEACRLCVDECATAGYDAIEIALTGTKADEYGRAVEGSGVSAPVVVAHKCVGCGLCQTRCRAIQAGEGGPLQESAIRIVAGEGREDRLTNGSYVKLRQAERQDRERRRRERFGQGTYLPDFGEKR